MNDHIVIYLNDHLAASVAGIELAKRCQSNNRGTDLGNFLETLVSTLQEEQALIKKLIARLNASESTTKKVAAWTAEKLGRLKLNDSIFSYSDLSRVLELETLIAGLNAQIMMWKVLGEHCSGQSNFMDINFAEAARKAEVMLEQLKLYHLRSGASAFCNGG